MKWAAAHGVRTLVMRVLLLMIFIAPFLVAAQANESRDQMVSEYCSRGYQFLKSKQYERAAENLEKAVSIDPNCVNAHSNLASAYGRLNRVEEAMQESEITLKLDPANQPAYVNYVGAALLLNRTSDALAMGERYLRKFPHGASRELITSEMAVAKRELGRRERRGETTSDQTTTADNYLNLVNTDGLRWSSAKMPLTVFIHPGQCRDYQPAFEQALIEAFTMWDQETRGAVKFTRTFNPNGADIVCNWTDDPNVIISDATGNEGGRCTPTASHGAYIHADLAFLTYRGADKQKHTPAGIKAIALHEIGHAIGLAGHSDHHKDIMYFVGHEGVRPILSYRDVNTATLLYTGKTIAAPNVNTQTDRAQAPYSVQQPYQGQPPYQGQQPYYPGQQPYYPPGAPQNPIQHQ